MDLNSPNKNIVKGAFGIKNRGLLGNNKLVRTRFKNC